MEERKNNFFFSESVSPILRSDILRSDGDSPLEKKLMLNLNTTQNKIFKSKKNKKRSKNIGHWISSIKEIIKSKKKYN
jgi:hypothetical protein